jgi:hypothetical protein
MYISPVERMKIIHLWIGTTAVDEAVYNLYFDQEDELSQFSKDIGLAEEYDEDFIGILPIFKNPPTVKVLLEKEIPIDKDSIAEVLAVCETMGIHSINAAFYLTDSTITIAKPNKKEYNGLRYLGEYKSAL